MAELDTALQEARAALEAGDPLEAFGAVRFFLASPDLAEQEAWPEAWTLFAEIADQIVGPPIGDHARRAAETPDDPSVLYDLGYEAMEVGLPDIAAGVLQRVNELQPGVERYVTEYVVALESLGRSDLAVETLEGQPALLESSFMCRYLLAFNAIMIGDDERAQALALEPTDDDQQFMADRIDRFLTRIDGLREYYPLDDGDLRGWQFVTTGSLLLHLSPYGYDEGMNGRYAFVQDSYAMCRNGLERLKTVLEELDQVPPRIFFVDERGAEALGRALADLLSVPLEPFPAEGTDRQGLVVAYDLALIDTATLYALHEKKPSQPLFAHAVCWTSPPSFAPDIHTFQYQSNVAPWGERMRWDEDREEMETSEPDPAPPSELAQQILDAPKVDAEVDSIEELVGFVRATAELPEEAAPTALVDRATRSRFWDSSPVPSNQFA